MYLKGENVVIQDRAHGKKPSNLNLAVDIYRSHMNFIRWE